MPYKILSILLLCACGEASAEDVKLSLPIRNAQANTIELKVGENPVLRLCGGPMPSSVSAPDGGTSFARYVLPKDWATTSFLAMISKAGDWTTIASATGKPTHFRLYGTNEKTTYMQGPVSVGGGGDGVTIPGLPVAGQPLSISTFRVGVP